MSHDIILSTRGLTVTYKTRGGDFNALTNINLDVRKGEVLGLVGESGCGKSTLGKALLRMIPRPGFIQPTSQIIFDGHDIMQYNRSQMRQLRGDRISMIFQDPMTSLNPVQRLDKHIIEAIRVHYPDVSQKEALERAQDLIERLGIGRKRLDDYPHQLSGGMRQRMMIGLALALRADVVIADEPTTSLDVIVEAQFMQLLRELKDEFGLTIILISHNIGLVAEMSDRVAVMYAGRLAEIAESETLFDNPKHPYSEGLLKSVPNLDLDDDYLYRMEGALPSIGNMPTGCRFNPRCPHVMDICREQDPTIQNVAEGDAAEQLVACWLHEEHPENV